MSGLVGRSAFAEPVTTLVRGVVTMAVLAVMGCTAPSAGGAVIRDDPSAPAAVTASPAPAAVTASPAPSLPPASTSPIASPRASFPDVTPEPTATVSGTPAAGIRTFPVKPDEDCAGMTVDDPLTLTLDLSQPELDGAFLTDRSDWNVHVVWPGGFAVGRDGDDRVLLDDRGKVVGRQGDDVTIPKTVRFPSGAFDEPVVAEGMLFGRCHRRAVEFPPGSAIRTTDEGLRMRTAPGTGASSPVFHAGLPLGASLYVLDGPVIDTGYRWYLVEWLDASPAVPLGWIAADELDGRRFVERDALHCPPPPTKPLDVTGLAYGYRAGCFAGQPLTIRARLVSCGCNIDGPFEGLEPTWLMPDYGPDGPWLLIDATAAGPSPILSQDLFVTRHPDSPSPDAWGGSIVRVTGMFGHPDLAHCERFGGDGVMNPADCSGTFVVTGMEPA